MNKLSSRLKKLRKEKNITQKELGNKINYSRTTISSYEQGTRNPDLKTLIKLADYFQVSLDYLIGRNNYNTYQQKNENYFSLNENSFNENKNSLIKSLSSITKFKTPYKKGHSQKVAYLSTAMASTLNLKKDQIKKIKTAALLKNIGEIQIPEMILNKPGKLNKTEYQLIQHHPEKSCEILKESQLDSEVMDIIFQHHERSDGSGYPHNLKKEEIKIEAKIIGLADTYIAITSRRSYCPKENPATAFKKIRESSKFETNLVNTCFQVINI